MLVNRRLLAFARTTIACILTCAAVLGIQPGEAASKCGDRNALVGIYPSAFEGEAKLVRQISAIVSTELIASLRASDDSTPGSNFGHGLVEPIGDGKPKCSQLILSGKVLPLGDDALFFAKLERIDSNDFRKSRPEVWTVAAGNQKISFDV